VLDYEHLARRFAEIGRWQSDVIDIMSTDRIAGDVNADD
jgi:hypothetical protein